MAKNKDSALKAATTVLTQRDCIHSSPVYDPPFITRYVCALLFNYQREDAGHTPHDTYELRCTITDYLDCPFNPKRR